MPSAIARNAGLAEAARILRPSGKLIITVYYYSLLKGLGNAVQPGRHVKEDKGPDYSFYFSRAEFKEWLAQYFEIESTTAVRSTILEKLPALGRFGLLAERALQRTPLSFVAAHLLQGVARKVVRQS